MALQNANFSELNQSVRRRQGTDVSAVEMSGSGDDDSNETNDHFQTPLAPGQILGSPMEFWLTAGMCLIAGFVVFPAAACSKRVSFRSGAFLGFGIQLFLIGFGLFVWLLSGASRMLTAAMCLVLCPIGMGLVHHGVLSWTSAMARRGNEDLAIVLGLGLLLILGFMSLVIWYVVSAMMYPI